MLLSEMYFHVKISDFMLEFGKYGLVKQKYGPESKIRPRPIFEIINPGRILPLGRQAVFFIDPQSID